MLRFIQIWLLATVMVIAAAPAGAGDVRDIRLAQHPGFTRAVLEYEGAVTHQIRNESRSRGQVIVELRGVQRCTAEVSRTGEEALVSSSRVSHRADTASARVYLRTAGEVSVSSFQLENPSRLVLDLSEGPGLAQPAAQSQGAAKPPTVQAQAPSQSSNTGFRPKIIVLDPGHGGHHKGGTGKLGGRTVYEKEVTRAVAFKAERLFRADPRFDVKLTIRNDDYLGLAERTQIASRLNGDLFVSIHTNAVEGKAAQARARGFEIWTWNREGNRSAAAKAVEKMENADPGVSNTNSSLITSMMMDALESQALVSRQAAKAFEASFMRHSYFKAHNRGIDSARFKVLEVYDMPSVLLELGFITHPEEVKMLFNDSFRDLCARAIYEGTVLFFERSDPSFPRAGSVAVARGR